MAFRITMTLYEASIFGLSRKISHSWSKLTHSNYKEKCLIRTTRALRFIDILMHYTVVFHASIKFWKLWYSKKIPNPEIHDANDPHLALTSNYYGAFWYFVGITRSDCSNSKGQSGPTWSRGDREMRTWDKILETIKHGQIPSRITGPVNGQWSCSLDSSWFPLN